jgi:hypothetical protein
VVVSGDASECMVTSEVAPSQYFDVNSGDLFIVPADSLAEYKVSVKSKKLGNRQVFLSGGELGILVDARVEKENASEDLKKLDISKVKL